MPNSCSKVDNAFGPRRGPGWFVFNFTLRNRLMACLRYAVSIASSWCCFLHFCFLFLLSKYKSVGLFLFPFPQEIFTLFTMLQIPSPLLCFLISAHGYISGEDGFTPPLLFGTFPAFFNHLASWLEATLVTPSFTPQFYCAQRFL